MTTGPVSQPPGAVLSCPCSGTAAEKPWGCSLSLLSSPATSGVYDPKQVPPLSVSPFVDQVASEGPPTQTVESHSSESDLRNSFEGIQFLSVVGIPASVVHSFASVFHHVFAYFQQRGSHHLPWEVFQDTGNLCVVPGSEGEAQRRLCPSISKTEGQATKEETGPTWLCDLAKVTHQADPRPRAWEKP